MNPYIVRMGIDGTIRHRVFRLPFELTTFGFNGNGPIVGGDAMGAGDSVYWAFTTPTGPLVIMRIDLASLTPTKIVALKPPGAETAPFARSHFTASTLRDGRLYVASNYRTTPHTTRGFLVVRDAATLAPLAGFSFDSPLEDQRVNIPLSIIPDPRSAKRFFLAGVAGRDDPDKMQQGTYLTYVAIVTVP
jgi:hypothetical protein